MKLTNKKIATTSAATFAAAFTSLYAAPELQAQATDLFFSDTTIPAGGAVASLNLRTADTTGFDAAIGTIGFANAAFDNRVLNVVTYLNGLAQVEPGILSTGNFSPTGTTNLNSLTGIQNVGFETFGGDVGFFTVDLGTGFGDATIIGGQVGLNGASVTVPAAVPEPAGGALAALALGAVGLRRKRKVA